MRKMGPKTPTEEELRLEVEELTDLLRTDQSFADLRAALATRHLRPEDVVLGGLTESEAETMWGVFVDRAGECTAFKILGLRGIEWVSLGSEGLRKLCIS